MNRNKQRQNIKLKKSNKKKHYKEDTDNNERVRNESQKQGDLDAVSSARE